MLEISFIISAFVAGLIMFLAPCTLPLVPGYLTFIGQGDKKKVVKNSLYFILGFTVVFVGFGVLAGVLGSVFNGYRLWLGRIGGIFVVIFGLYMLGVFNLKFLQVNTGLRFPGLKPGKSKSAFLLGTSFAAGWTPCVGPILASILLLATSTTSLMPAIVLLLIFSLGLAIPFFVLAFLYEKSEKLIGELSRMKWVKVVGGLILIFLGVLLVTDNFFLLLRWGFDLLEVFNYQGILKSL